ncbi:MAG: sporulation protein YunB [Erysipelotrichales bacterium]|nr:sporulation protein YunB [Erysipelotrichales bacterium]
MMLSKIKSKLSKTKISIFGKTLIIFVSFIASSIYGIKATSNNFKSHILDYALIQAQKVMTYISTTVVEELNEEYSISSKDLITYETNSDDVTTIEFDTKFLNSFLKIATTKTLYLIKEVENGKYDNKYFPESQTYKNSSGIVYEIPVGLITNNVILSNVGGKVPIKFECLGSVEGNIVSKTSSFGLNNALINIYLNLSINTQVVVPDSSTIQNTQVEMPIFMYIINGKVPSYYYGTNMVCNNIADEVGI